MYEQESIIDITMYVGIRMYSIFIIYSVPKQYQYFNKPFPTCCPYLHIKFLYSIVVNYITQRNISILFHIIDPQQLFLDMQPFCVHILYCIVYVYLYIPTCQNQGIYLYSLLSTILNIYVITLLFTLPLPIYYTGRETQISISH